MFGQIFFATLLAASPVRVGTAGSAPFITKDNQGIATEVWSSLAKKKGLEYEITQHYKSVEEALVAKREGKLDVVVGPISINSKREREYGDFSQPYFEAKMGVMAPRSESALSYIKPFFNGNFFFGLGIFVSLLFVVGCLIWMAERKKNEDFDLGAHGILEGAWFSLVTMTTVGYGDKAPKTHLGRGLTAIWMLVGILMFSTLTAFLANAFDTSNADIGNISGKRIAVVTGSTGEHFAQQRGAKILTTETLAEAIDALESDRVQGIVFDGPALQYHLKNSESNFAVHLYDGSSENYGFMSDIDIDPEILEMKESGEIQSITNRWLSEI